MGAGRILDMNDAAREPLDCVVRETGPSPAHTIVWLHGLGADGHDFEPIVPQLQCTARRPVRFVFPHAPVRPVTVNNGMSMRAWYDIRGLEIDRDQDATGIADSLARVNALVDAELARGVDPGHLVLAGFSQGGAIALRTGLARSSPLAGVVGLSCYLLQADRLSDWAAPESAGVPVFMGHGDVDPIVPAVLGRRSARFLEEAGYHVQWWTWPMAHAVSPGEIARLDEWLDRRFSGDGAA